jgi:hypothetical protein
MEAYLCAKMVAELNLNGSLNWFVHLGGVGFPSSSPVKVILQHFAEIFVHKHCLAPKGVPNEV